MRFHAILILASLLLASCDILQAPEAAADSYQDQVPDVVAGARRCSFHVVPASLVDEVDSAVAVPYSDSGTYSPVLVRTFWVSVDGTCSVADPSNVVGGFKGIRRYFGKWKRAPENPNVPGVVL